MEWHGLIGLKILTLFMYGWGIGHMMSAIIGLASVSCCIAKIFIVFHRSNET